MKELQKLFATSLYRAQLEGGRPGLNRDLGQLCRLFAEEDGAGKQWSRAHGYHGYTSYASLNDLLDRASAFAELAAHLDAHVADFAKACDFDLRGERLELDSVWVNVLYPGGVHSGHIHPHGVVSGTYYVQVPKGASAIRFEDPRLGLMMAAPQRKARARLYNQPFVSVEPAAGTVLLWESWLRHEVVMNQARGDRLSISFNYAMARHNNL